MYATASDTLQLYYELHGPSESREVIVFLNGLSQSTTSWGLTLPYFKDRYRVLLLDFIFQGKSDKSGESRSFDQHAEDVLMVLKKEGMDKIILVGLSYGSLVAQHFALRYPEVLSKLILVSTFAHKTPYYEAIENAWWRALEAGGYALMLDIMLPSVLSEQYFKNPLIPIDLMKQSRQDMNDDASALFKLMKATRERPDYRAKLSGIHTPTLVVQGENDFLLPVHMAQEVAKHIPGSRLQIILAAGHTLNLEAVPAMAKAILDFIGE